MFQRSEKSSSFSQLLTTSLTDNVISLKRWSLHEIVITQERLWKKENKRITNFKLFASVVFLRVKVLYMQFSLYSKVR